MIGLFWNYLEENNKSLVICEEDEYLFHKIDTKENNNYLFKISFYRNKINIDYFHLLTDGKSGSEFLKALVYNYIDIKNNKEKISIYK